MSTSYHFICPEKRIRLWMGQSSGFNPLRIYTADQNVMAMADFLERTEGKAIHFKSEHQMNGDEYDYEEIDMDQYKDSEDWPQAEKNRLHGELNRIFPKTIQRG